MKTGNLGHFWKPDLCDGKYKHDLPKKKRQKKLYRKKKSSSQKRKKFYQSHEWKRLRYEAFKKYGNRCMCCGATPSDGYTLQVDHIKSIKRAPHLALDINNLQILCASCNWGKFSEDETDWRSHMNSIVNEK